MQGVLPSWYDARDVPPRTDADLQQGVWLQVAEVGDTVVSDAHPGDVILHSGHDSQRVILTSGTDDMASALSISDARIDVSRRVTFSNSVNLLDRIIDTVNDDVKLLGTRFTGSNIAANGLRVHGPPLATHTDRPALSTMHAAADVSNSPEDEARQREAGQPWPGEVRGDHFLRLVTSMEDPAATASFIELFSRKSGVEDMVDGAIAFGTSGEERLRITSSGWIGAGTSNPTARLTVEDGHVHVQRSTSGDPARAALTVRHNVGYDGLTVSHALDGSSVLQARDGPLAVASSNSVTFCNDSRGFTAIINDAGYLGVSVADPKYHVDVGGDVRARSTVIGQTTVIGNPSFLSVPTYSGLWHCNEGPGRPIILHDVQTGVTQLGCTNGGGIAFSDENAPMASIVDGKFGVGTIEPVATLDVRGTVAMHGPTLSVGSNLRADVNVGLDVQGRVRATKCMYVGETSAVGGQGPAARRAIHLSHLEFTPELDEQLASDTQFAFIVVAALEKDDQSAFGTVNVTGDLGAKVVDDPHDSTGFIHALLTLVSSASEPDSSLRVRAHASWRGGSALKVSQHADLLLYLNEADVDSYKLVLKVTKACTFSLDVSCSAAGVVPTVPAVSFSGPPPGHALVRSLLTDGSVRHETVSWGGLACVGPALTPGTRPPARFTVLHETLGECNAVMIQSAEVKLASMEHQFSLLGPSPGRPYVSISDTTSALPDHQNMMGAAVNQPGLVLRRSAGDMATRVAIGYTDPTQLFDVNGISKAGHMLMAGDASLMLPQGGMPDAGASERGAYIGFNLRGDDGSVTFINHAAGDGGTQKGFVFVDYSTMSNCMRISPTGTTDVSGHFTCMGGSIVARAASEPARMMLSNAVGMWSVSGPALSNTPSVYGRELVVGFSCNMPLPPVLRVNPGGHVAINQHAATDNLEETLRIRAATSAQSGAAIVRITNAEQTHHLRLEQSGTPASIIEAEGDQDLILMASSKEILRASGADGFVGIRNADPKAALAFSNDTAIRKIALYDDGLTDEADRRFDGFGYTDGALRYHTHGDSVDHVFYSARGVSADQELLRISGDAAGVCIGGVGEDGILSALDVRGDLFVSTRINVGACNMDARVPLSVHVSASGSTEVAPAVKIINTCNDEYACASLALETSDSNARAFLTFQTGGGVGLWSVGACNDKFIISPHSDPAHAGDTASIAIDRDTSFIGVGKTNPTCAIDVVGSITASDMITAAANASLVATDVAVPGSAAVNTAFFGHREVLGKALSAAALSQTADGLTTTIASCNAISLSRNGTSTAVYVDVTTNRLGVGTSNPQTELQVNGSCRISSNLFVDSNMDLQGDLYVRGKIFNNSLGGGNSLDLVGNEFSEGGLINNYVSVGHLKMRNPYAVANASEANSNDGAFLQPAWSVYSCNDSNAIAVVNPLASCNDNLFWFRGQALTISPEGLHASGLRMDSDGYINIPAKLFMTSQEGTRPSALLFSDDADLGVYGAPAGADRSLTLNGTAVAGAGFSSNALRVRVGSGIHNGLIIESSDDSLAASVRADGVSYIKQALGVSAEAPQDKLHVHGGHLRLSGASENALRFAGQGPDVRMDIAYVNTTGTDGRLLFRSPAQNSGGNSTAHVSVTESTGRVGIATDNPLASVHVKLHNPASDSLLVDTGGTGDNSILMSATGISIGYGDPATAAQTAKLTIRNAASNSADDNTVMRFVNPSASAASLSNAVSQWLAFSSAPKSLGNAESNASAVDEVARIGVRMTASNEASLVFDCGTSGTLAPGAEKMVIDPRGHVGIATGSPLSRLHVQDGNLAVTSSNSMHKIIMDVASPASDAFAGTQRTPSGISHVLMHAREAHIFETFDTDRVELARITGAGRLGVGVQAPNASVHVSGSMLTNKASTFCNVELHRSDIPSEVAQGWNHLTFDATDIDIDNGQISGAAALFAFVKEAGGALLHAPDGGIVACTYDSNGDYFNAVAPSHRSLLIRRVTAAAGGGVNNNNIFNSDAATTNFVVQHINVVNTVRSASLSVTSMSAEDSGDDARWHIAQSPNTLNNSNMLAMTYTDGKGNAFTAMSISRNGDVYLGAHSQSSAIGMLDVNDPRHPRPVAPDIADKPALFVTACNTDSSSTPIAQFRTQDLTQGVGISADSVIATGSRAHQRLCLAAKGSCNVEVNSHMMVATSDASARPLLTLENADPVSIAALSLKTASNTASIALSSGSLVVRNETGGPVLLQANNNTNGIEISSRGGSNLVSVAQPEPAQYANLSVSCNMAIVSSASEPARVFFGSNDAHSIGLSWTSNSLANPSSTPSPVFYMSADVENNADIVLGHRPSDAFRNDPPQRSIVVSSTGNVGMGTARKPSANLHVSRDVFIEAAGPMPGKPLRTTMGLDLAFQSNAQVQRGVIASRHESNGVRGDLALLAREFTLHAGSLDQEVEVEASAMRLSAAGLLGIGTLVPAAKLDVRGDAVIQGTFMSSNAVGTLWVAGGDTPASLARALSPAVSTERDVIISTNASGLTLCHSNSSTSIMRLSTATGFLGVGTADPQFRAHVAGSLYASNIAFGPSNSMSAPSTVGTLQLQGASAGGFQGLNVSNSLALVTSNAGSVMGMYNVTDGQWLVRSVRSAAGNGTNRTDILSSGSVSGVFSSSNVRFTVSNVDVDSNLTVRGRLYLPQAFGVADVSSNALALSTTSNPAGQADLVVNEAGAFSQTRVRKALRVYHATASETGGAFTTGLIALESNVIDITMASGSAERYAAQLMVAPADDASVPGRTVKRGDLVLRASSGQAVSVGTTLTSLCIREDKVGLGTAYPSQRVQVVDGSILLSQSSAVPLDGQEPRVLLGSNESGVLRFGGAIRTQSNSEMFGVHTMVGSNDGFFAGMSMLNVGLDDTGALVNATTAKPVIAWGDASDLLFYANPSRAGGSLLREVARFTSNGALGIGTSSGFPEGERLAVAGSVFVGSQALRGLHDDTGASASARITLDSSGDESSEATNAIPANKIRLRDVTSSVAGLGVSSNQMAYHTGSHHVFYTGTTQSAYGAETMRITSDCNVGIGVKQPTTRLHINGDVLVEGDTATMRIANQTSFAISSATDTAGRFVVRPDGRAGLQDANPSATLQVGVQAGGAAADPRSNGISIVNSNASSTAHAVLNLRTAVGAVGGDAFISVEVPGTQGWSAGVNRQDANKFKISASSNNLRTNTMMTVTTDGRVGIGASASNPSDRLHVDAGNVLATGGAFFATPNSVGTAQSSAPNKVFFGISNATSDPVGLGTGDVLQDLRLFAPLATSKQSFSIAGTQEMELSRTGLFVRSNITASNLYIGSNAGILGRLRVGSDTLSMGLCFPSASLSNACISACNVTLRMDACGSNGLHVPACLSLTPDGRLGIGTSNPLEKLHVEGGMTLGAGAALTFKGVTSTRFHTFIAENKYAGVDATELILAKIGETSSPDAGPDRIRHIAAQHVFQIYSSNTDAPISVSDAAGRGYTSVLTVNSNACVGIGSASPLHALDVTGSINWASGQLLSNGVPLPAQNLFAWFITSNGVYAPFNCNVGINTSNPTHSLDVRGSFNVSNVITYSGLAADAFLITNNCMSRSNLTLQGSLAIGAAVAPTFVPDASLHVTSGNMVMQAIHAAGTSNPSQWIEWRASNATPRFAIAASLPGGALSNNRLFFCYYNESGNAPTEANSIVTVRSDGNVGIGVNNPTSIVHVVGNAAQLYTRIVANDRTDGGLNRGIMMWGSNDNAWGMYMATSGAGKSFSGGASVPGNDFLLAALRMRVLNSVDTGFIIENSSEQLLASVNGSTGNTFIKGSLATGGSLSTGAITASGAINAGANTLACGAITSSGNMRMTGASGVLTLEGPSSRLGVGTTSPTDTLHVSGNSYLLGRVRISDGVDTPGSSRGLAFWNDNNWGVYVSTPGTTKSFSGGIAATAAGLSSLSMRLRCSNATTQGFLFENSSENVLSSINGNSGSMYLLGSLSNDGNVSTNAVSCTNVTTRNAGAVTCAAATVSNLSCPGSASLATTSTTCNVGIGTITPAYKLDVNGDGRFTQKIAAGNANTADITAAVNVRPISNTTPAENGLYVFNPTNTAGNNATACLRVAGTSAGNPFYSLDVNGSSGWSMGIDNADQRKLKFRNDWNFGAGTDRVTLTQTGFLGIGTTDPSKHLHVQGGDILLHTGYLQVTTGRVVTNNGTNNATNGIQLWSSNDKNWGIYVAANAGGAFAFNGGTAVAGGTDGFTSNAMRFRCQQNDANGFVWESGNTGAADSLLASLNGLTGEMWVKGDVTVLSDARFKTDLKPIDTALDKVCRLHGYTYAMKGDPSGKRHTGLLAQEVYQVLPEAVHKNKRGAREEEVFSVAYGNMIGLLVEAIKDMKQEITNIKNQLRN